MFSEHTFKVIMLSIVLLTLVIGLKFLVNSLKYYILQLPDGSYKTDSFNQTEYFSYYEEYKADIQAAKINAKVVCIWSHQKDKLDKALYYRKHMREK